MDFITEGEAKHCSINIACLPPRDNGPPLVELRTMRYRDDPAVRFDGLWPLVRFETGGQLLCNRCSFDVKNTEGEVEAIREQVRSVLTWSLSVKHEHRKVPLILAWALSVHKSQGQTLKRVRVDLRRAFETGQGLFDSRPRDFTDKLKLVLSDSICRTISRHESGDSRGRELPS